jgi:hypothetical protein
MTDASSVVVIDSEKLSTIQGGTTNSDQTDFFVANVAEQFRAYYIAQGGINARYYSLGTSTSTAATNINGSLIDGYIRDATGQIVDLSDNSVVKTFTTNSVGYWSVDISNSELPEVYKVNFLPGGVDIATGKTISASFSTISTKSQTNNLSSLTLNITPITTLKSNIIETKFAVQPSNITNIITDADTKIAEAFGITRYDIGKDFISLQDQVVLKAAIKVNLVVETLKINITAEDSSVTGDNVITALATVIENGSGVFDFTDATNVTNIVNNSTSVTLSAISINNSITISSKSSTNIDEAVGDFNTVVNDVVKTTVATIDTVTSIDKNVEINSTSYENAITAEKDNVNVGQIYSEPDPEPEPEPQPEPEPEPMPEPEPEEIQKVSNYNLLDGAIPNWLQPTNYNNPMGGYEATFNAWCSPTTAANHLGYMVDNNFLTLPPVLNDGVIAGNTQPNADYTSTIGWDTAHGWGDYLLDGPTYRGVTAINIVTDFGWYMNTNNLGVNGATANSAVGTKI